MTAAPFDWMEHYPAAVTVCDAQGTIVAMNRLAIEAYDRYGGSQLLGTCLFACHPEPANAIIRTQLEQQRANSYFVVKEGVRKLVHQAPWYHQGQFAGLVETVTVLPETIVTKKRS
ncbi:MAG: PAS domain-containing protein [Desulfobulbus sp.]|jgi:PAS domain-containing protein|uniref:PAS domain-containing protein n=1 Tax=Desulfobulbus sp. TaxID=895 RepID=UPI002850525D|nr:PAS domain-containing protein [Desulfobulbus sp.]MDR2550085.1 PAS domain-containing protein [Desulfobulbus sp.]